jgi:hypothetical protein
MTEHQLDWEHPQAARAVPAEAKARAGAASDAAFANTDVPNDTWCIDFKGKFRMRDGEWVHVLTLLDAQTRYLLRAEAMLRSDNGPPFASTGAGRLSKLSVWWLKLGIALERIKPGHPEQNGRLERCHRTLKEDVPPAEDLILQRRALDEWRREYNDERPHESLGDVPPERLYRRSPRRYPRKLLKPESPPWRDACDVDNQGYIRWRKHKLFISSALAGETVELECIGNWTWQIRFLDLIIAELDDRKLDRGIRLKRKPQPAAV